MRYVTHWFTRWDVKGHGMSFETIEDPKLNTIFQFTTERPWGRGSMYVKADLNRKEAFELMEALRISLFDSVEAKE